jgi:hypothetical protein
MDSILAGDHVDLLEGKREMKMVSTISGTGGEGKEVSPLTLTILLPKAAAAPATLSAAQLTVWEQSATVPNPSFFPLISSRKQDLPFFSPVRCRRISLHKDFDPCLLNLSASAPNC